MSQVLALTSGLLYGIADFGGGLASRSLAVWRVTAWSQVIGLPLLAVGLLVVEAPHVTGHDLLYGAIGGFFGLFGLVALYDALAKGTMSVVSPITGALTATIPLLWGLATGESIVAPQWLGIALALVAVLLIASDHTDVRMTPRIVATAVFASLGFAAFFIVFSQTSQDAGLWPLATARAVTIPIALGFATATSTIALPARSSLPPVAVAGTADMGANVAILLALQTGPLGISTVLTSLYPAFTALAAIVVLRERPNGLQALGILLALGAAAILAI